MSKVIHDRKIGCKLTMIRVRYDCQNVSHRNSLSSSSIKPKSPPNNCIKMGANNAVSKSRKITT